MRKTVVSFPASWNNKKKITWNRGDVQIVFCPYNNQISLHKILAVDQEWCRLMKHSLACVEIPLKLRSWKLRVGSLILPLIISESDPSLMQGQICQVIFWLFPCLSWWEDSFPLLCWRICKPSSPLTGAWYLSSLQNAVNDGDRKTA